MSAAIVEVKDDATFAYYKAYVKDFNGNHCLIHFERGWKPDEWVDPRKVRMSVPAHDKDMFSPQVGDLVEAMAKSQENEPFSWWSARVKSIKGEFYLISYTDWGDSYNEIVEKDLLRPLNPNGCYAPNELAKAEVQIPNDALDSADDKQDPQYQQNKQAAYASIQQKAALLSLIEDPERRVLVLIGAPRAIETGKILASMHLKHQAQLNVLRNRQKQQQQHLQEQKQKLQSLYVNEFSVPPALLGLVIGKGGKNIKAAEKIEGVESIKVHNEKNIIVVTAKNQEAFDRVRAMLEFVSKTYPVLRSDIGRFVGKGYAYIREIEAASKVVRIIVPTDEKSARNNNAANGHAAGANGKDAGAESAAPAGRGGRGGGRGGRGGRAPQPSRSWGDSADETVLLEIVGTPDAVNNALLLLENRTKFLQEASLLLSGTDAARDQLRELEARFGIMRAAPRPATGTGAPRRQKTESAGSGDSAPTDAAKPEEAKAKRQQKERPNKPKKGDAAPSDATADAEKKEAADKEADAKPRAPKPRKERKPAGNADALVQSAAKTDA